MIGKGTPRGLQGRKSIISNALSLLLSGPRSILVIFDNDLRKEMIMMIEKHLFAVLAGRNQGAGRAAPANCSYRIGPVVIVKSLIVADQWE